MEPSSSSAGEGAGDSATASCVGRKRWRASVAPSASINSLGTDLLSNILGRLDPFELVRYAAVCKIWYNTIYHSSLMRDLYYKQKLHDISKSSKSIPDEAYTKRYIEVVAMEQHRLAFLGNFAEALQWSSHSTRISLCRLKRGLILTGAEDKVMRLWSAESCKCLNEYSNPISPLVDYDFDENKIVGLTGAQICIWMRNSRRNVFQSREDIFSRGICMRYMDPEAVVGCHDGRARVLDMYSGRCTRIIRMHTSPVSCLALSEDQLLLSGTLFGSVSVADLSTGEWLATLKSSVSPTGMKSLCLNKNSYMVFAGSTAGYAHCWDLRTLRPLWETRVGPNVIYSVHNLSNDTATLAVGGLDGVLRILNQSTGEILSSFILDPITKSDVSPGSSSTVKIIKREAKVVPSYIQIDRIPRSQRPPITCLAVGLKKIVTAHNEKYISLWRFNK